MKSLELLAPARNAEIGRTAIRSGADAVYIGAPAFGARAAATNPVSDIEALATYAHRFGAAVYVTMNTVLLDSELEAARRTVHELYSAGVDALIVQDMAYLMMDLPPIALHASTQCDIRTPEKAAMLAAAGFGRVVLARELSAAQIAEIAARCGVPVEVFIHGARCVSYSGDCQMGFDATGRSANRGECPQMCRLPFDLVDADGRALGPRRHYLSLSDMSTPDIAALARAGASSFKIEGRLKDEKYVANAVAWYSARLDALVTAEPERWCRSSRGRAVPGFVPDISKAFFRRPNGGGREVTLGSPKDTGMPVGKVTGGAPRRRSFRFVGEALANGDGLGFFAPDGTFTGFRLNRIDGAEAFPAGEVPQMAPGTVIYRNSDKKFADMLAKAVPERFLTVDFDLAAAGDGKIMLTARCGDVAATATADIEPQTARTPQTEGRRRLLGRLGGTGYEPGAIVDSLGDDAFVPASALADLRRRVLADLDAALPAAHRREQPAPRTLAPDAFSALPPLTYHDNVANALAEKFYLSHGATIESRALESGASPGGERRVMQTRYCLRRELGACLRTPAAAKLPDGLHLRTDAGSLYRLEFDCDRCGMNIYRKK